MSDTAMLNHILDSLRADSSVQAVLGNPARIFDGETTAPAYPYAVLERHESKDTSASGVLSAAHHLQFAVLSRTDGQRGSREIISVLRTALQRLPRALDGQQIVLIHPTYSDTMRSRGVKTYRGVLRVRIHSEEVSS